MPNQARPNASAFSNGLKGNKPTRQGNPPANKFKEKCGIALTRRGFAMAFSAAVTGKQRFMRLSVSSPI
jgi:hypothetical protein